MSPDASQKQAGNPPEVVRSRPGRLAIGNSSSLKARLRSLDDIDRRCRAAQKAFQFRDELANDLAGGWGQLTAAQKELVQSAALISALIADAGAAVLDGQPVDAAELSSLVNVQRRLLTTLGLERRPHQITPDPRTLSREERRQRIAELTAKLEAADRPTSGSG